VVPTVVGEHTQVTDNGPDINGFAMVVCGVCHTRADCEEDLARVRCNAHCQNCKNLRRSNDEKPAVPAGGSSIHVLHVCPYDGNRWWQSNTHFHLWQQVTRDSEWDSLLNPSSDYGEW
jgi:hypothetical protein